MRLNRLLFFCLIAITVAPPLLAQSPSDVKVNQLKPPTTSQADADTTPALVRWMFYKSDRNIQVVVPVVAADHNSGLTTGIMPIWVTQKKNSDDIKSIQAPSMTYNQYFGWEATYRYYYFPTSNASFTAIGTAGKYENEALLEYKDTHIKNTNADVDFRLHKNVDASGRFFGIGAASAL